MGAPVRRWLFHLGTALSASGCALVASLGTLENSVYLADGGANSEGSVDGAGQDSPFADSSWGSSWCSTHHDEGTLFCNDFDNGHSELQTIGDHPPGPWSFKQQGNGGFIEGLSTNCMPNSTPSSLLVNALKAIPATEGFTLDQFITVQSSITGVILTFDLRVEDYSAASQDLSIVKIGTHNADPAKTPWWVSWDYNINTGQLAEFGAQTPGAAPTILATNHTPVPDFTVARYYHVVLAVDLVLYNAWWVFDAAQATYLLDGGSNVSDADTDDAAGDAAGDAAASDGGPTVFPLNAAAKYRTHYQLQYFQGSTYQATFPDAGAALDIVIGENYGKGLASDTSLYFDNIRVQAVPPEGLPTGPTFPANDAGL